MIADTGRYAGLGSGERLGLERSATSQGVVVVRVCVWAQTRDDLGPFRRLVILDGGGL